MYFQEVIPHKCAHCNSTTNYVFSIDLEYQVEGPFLCSETCYEEYAISQLNDDTEYEDFDCEDMYDEKFAK